MVDILYLFGYSPRLSNRLEKLAQIVSLQKALGKSVGLALVHDGVTGAGPQGLVPKSILSLLEQGIQLFALGPDLDARGIASSNLEKDIVRIDYDRLMELIVEANTLCSWM